MWCKVTLTLRKNQIPDRRVKEILSVFIAVEEAFVVICTWFLCQLTAATTDMMYLEYGNMKIITK